MHFPVCHVFFYLFFSTKALIKEETAVTEPNVSLFTASITLDIMIYSTNSSQQQPAPKPTIAHCDTRGRANATD